MILKGKATIHDTNIDTLNVTAYTTLKSLKD